MRPGEFTLPSGRRVHIEALHIEPTLAGVIEGTAEGIRRGVLQEARYARQWGERATHVIVPPQSSPFDIGLGTWKVTVWLMCDEPLSPKRDGSELVVAFFEETISGRSILDLVAAAVRDVDWRAHAADHDGP